MHNHETYRIEMTTSDRVQLGDGTVEVLLDGFQNYGYSIHQGKQIVKSDDGWTNPVDALVAAVVAIGEIPREDPKSN